MDEQSGTDRDEREDDGGGGAVAVGLRVNDFETVRKRVCDHHTREYEREALDALDRIEAEVERLRAGMDKGSRWWAGKAGQAEAERDELLVRLGRMEGEYRAAAKMILDRDEEVERLRADVEFWKETHASAVEHYKAQDINELHHENGRLRVERDALARILEDEGHPVVEEKEVHFVDKIE
jgi:hypothetical protein